ncbi:WLM-domain-containing protein [Gloeophyllum trabeum ATCC 11539]|uniref:WLM-domain-containing protein n=1 Tax=Gloeophyllum trabeum (strain ATCC 11539 / FP-39264 / Madison 617) TaxID=670483 RepID=S7RMY4_GLOTA|nr:WLM-domain-containing protein [Gloeophyllum trabeum ATCC 11539]EPQ54069.1 WLM-domain-containing protein [Gloeophyllum trabeum ATCC 11539]
MVHHRINERETNPNPHINFITALPMPQPEAQEAARQLLRALAAQVRPIMKAHGFSVNSFEEYEYNRVFAGRNWEAGETVELVLRRPDGRFYPNSWLLSTLCHELAHIKHMNHGPAFQALWRQLNSEVRALQNKGYYGDGYWSSGKLLLDSSLVGGQTLETGDLPEYMCGGAQTRTRPTRRRRRTAAAGPSNHTGAQTAKRRKAGSRVKAEGAFVGKGTSLNDDISDEDIFMAILPALTPGISKRAREERALAAERRLRAIQGGSQPKERERSSGDEGEDEFETKQETDQERRNTMMDMMKESELDDLKMTKHDFWKDFAISSTSRPPRGEDKDPLHFIDLTSDDDRHRSFSSCPPASAIAGLSSNKHAKNPTPAPPTKASTETSSLMNTSSSSSQLSKGSTKPKQDVLRLGNIVQDEVKTCKKESLGLNGPARRLGAAPARAKLGSPGNATEANRLEGLQWACEVCTLLNQEGHLACSACGTARDAPSWSGSYR